MEMGRLKRRSRLSWKKVPGIRVFFYFLILSYLLVCSSSRKPIVCICFLGKVVGDEGGHVLLFHDLVDLKCRFNTTEPGEGVIRHVGREFALVCRHREVVEGSPTVNTQNKKL